MPFNNIFCCTENHKIQKEFLNETFIANVILSISDEIWKLTRSPHLKYVDAVKLDQAIASYSLQDTPFITFNNTEDTCRVNSGSTPDISSLILTSAAAITLFRRMY